jgi:hypothetical protein
MRNQFRFFALPGRLCVLALPAMLALPLIGPSSADAREYDPFVMYVFPAGAPRGTTVEGIMARGRGLEGTSEVHVSGKGVTGKVLAIEEPSTALRQRSANRQDQAENPNVVKFSVTIAPDAEPGQRDLWLITPKGPTNRMHFVVGQVPEVNEADEETDEEANEGEPQLLESLPILVNGQYNQGDHDVFRFPAKAGQTLVCELQGQKLVPYIADAVPGWFQPCVSLYDSTGKELAYVDDFRFHPDPLLVYKVEQDGEYLIEVKDALFRGREDLVYRLSIGARPYITHVYPLGGPRNAETQIELHGANLPAASTSFAVPADSPPIRQVKVTGNGLTSNALPFAVGNTPEAQETEPNDSLEQAGKIETPVTVNGRIQKSGDLDYFRLTTTKGQRLVMEVRARRLESPLDSIITLLNATGQRLAENDDTTDLSEGLITHHADSYLAYTFPADGDYLLRIRDVQNQGGEEYAYRLRVTPPQPDFDLRVVPANLRVEQGASTLAKIKAYRQDGFPDEIDVAVEGLPAGFTASPATIPRGQTEVLLTITAPGDAPTGVTSPTFIGTAVLGGTEAAQATLRRQAIPAEELMQAFYYWQDVPTQECLLAVVEPYAFTLSSDISQAEVLQAVQGSTLSMVVKASRQGLQARLQRAEAEKKAAEEALAKVKADLGKAKADYDSAEKAAKEAEAAAAKAPEADKAQAKQVAAEKRKLAGEAKARHDALPNQEKAANAQLAEVNKKVAEAGALLKGTISLKADPAPRGVTVKAANIAADQNEATVTLTITNQAPVGFRQNIIITGTLRVGPETITRVAPAVPINVLAPPPKK